MMNPIQEAKEYIQEYTETIAQVLDIEATIVDQDCLRAGGPVLIGNSWDCPFLMGPFISGS